MSGNPGISLIPGISNSAHLSISSLRTGFATSPVGSIIAIVACGEKDSPDVATGLNGMQQVWAEKEQIIIFMCNYVECFPARYRTGITRTERKGGTIMG
jgi:hypothetical protein